MPESLDLTALADMLDRRLDAIQATLDKIAAGGDGSAAVPPAATDPVATVHTMTVGGWMRRPGSPRWLPIAAITECAGPYNCWRIDFDLKNTDPDGTCVHVDGGQSFPFLTAEQFDRDCAREQTDDAAVRDLQQQRARDFGHDDPAAA